MLTQQGPDKDLAPYGNRTSAKLLYLYQASTFYFPYLNVMNCLRIMFGSNDIIYLYARGCFKWEFGGCKLKEPAGYKLPHAYLTCQ